MADTFPATDVVITVGKKRLNHQLNGKQNSWALILLHKLKKKSVLVRKNIYHIPYIGHHIHIPKHRQK